jgi:hypothetical protein
MVAHVYNHSTQEAEAGGLRVQGKPGPHSGNPVSTKQKKIKQNKQKALKKLLIHYNLYIRSESLLHIF